MIDDDMIITQRRNNCQMSVMVRDRRWLKSIKSAKDCWDQIRSTTIAVIAVISPGSGRVVELIDYYYYTIADSW